MQDINRHAAVVMEGTPGNLPADAADAAITLAAAAPVSMLSLWLEHCVAPFATKYMLMQGLAMEQGAVGQEMKACALSVISCHCMFNVRWGLLPDNCQEVMKLRMPQSSHRSLPAAWTIFESSRCRTFPSFVYRCAP